MQPWALRFRPLLLWLLLPWPGAGEFQVQGPRSPVIAQVEEAAVLPCDLSPPTDAQNMKIRWYRDHQSVLVHEYRNSQDHREQQSLEYPGRTELLRENIAQGQVALRVHPILPGDEGQYSCVFESSSQLSQAQFELLVAAAGETPRIHIQPVQTGSITLTCSSSGWYPDPELQWRDPQGRPLSPDSETRSIREDGLIQVASSITLKESSRAVIACSTENPVLREEKESRLSVAEALFPRVSAWTVVLAVLLALLAVTLMITAVLLLRSRRDQGRFTKEIEQSKLSVRNGLKEARRFAEDIILDEDTAHPQLLVSGGGKRVECLLRERAVPERPGRFTSLRAVLGQDIFFRGRHYWEVDVRESKQWTIGLYSVWVNEKSNFENVHPKNGFWSIERDFNNYRALSLPRHNLNVTAPPSVVGIFLLYEEGLISFYDVKKFSILHTFTDKFTKPLRPYFLNHYVFELNYCGLFLPAVSSPDKPGPP